MTSRAWDRAHEKLIEGFTNPGTVPATPVSRRSLVDVTYGNVTQEEADRLADAVGCWKESPAGNTEPWITNLVVALLKASGARTVLETGAFQGATSEELLRALEAMDGGVLTICEIDPARAEAVDARLREVEWEDSKVNWVVRCMDARDVIRSLAPQSLGFAFIDDDHQKAHVAEEIELLLPKMLPGGLLVFHDVYGVCDLQEVVAAYGGFSLDLPRAGPAGGLGIIQVR